MARSSTERWLIALGAGGAATGLAFWKGRKAVSVVEQAVSAIKRGSKVTNAEAPKGGVTPADPLALAAQARVSPDIYAMARVLASESSAGSEPERIAVAWVLRNDAREAGRSILAHVTASTNPSAQGKFGSQNVGGRRFSSRFDPRQGDVDLAIRVMGGAIPDNTGGATKFAHLAAQDALAAKGEKGYTMNAAQLVAKWAADGYDLREVPGVPRSRFVVFVKRDEARVA